jgi:transposase
VLALDQEDLILSEAQIRVRGKGMNKALDEVRVGESRRIANERGVPVLKKSRWLLLKREENLKTERRFRLRDLLRYNLKTVRT